MNMIESQLQDLEKLKAFIALKCNADVTCEEARKPLKIIDEAINAIKELSAKLSAANMERSSQYYNGGWIPCSERLPEEKPSIFAELKGTGKWRKSMWEKSSDKVLITVEYKDGGKKTDVASTEDGEWNTYIVGWPFEVIAWQPLPEPYGGNER